ncbi:MULTISPECIES: anti-sigma factor domain-containing protein [Acidobacteriaceae]|uniref:anti-sigma factor n=1 Tax=Acidobacteriaceae TaxID=204434 RepID=UPI00131DCDF3|nr:MULTISPECIES: anti-sigma factor [Acidobacteriaceae]MDW5265419.1 anti-sigma factor [Edaphobacter sp.]
MNTTGHIERDDLVLFAMQLLSQEEHAVAAAHITNCPECRHELAEVQGDLAVYAHSVEMQAPPASARERLMKQVAHEKKVISIDTASAAEPELPSRGFGGRSSLTEDDLPPRGFAGRVFPWLGWALAAGLAVTAGNFYMQRTALQGSIAEQKDQIAQLTTDAATAHEVMETMTDRNAMRVTLTKAQTAPVPQARATYVAEKGLLIFQANNMEPLQPAKVYELWLIPANGSNPIPAGTFQPDQRGYASIVMPPLPKGVEAKAFGVTIENEGGSQTPTLPIVMVGA